MCTQCQITPTVYDDDPDFEPVITLEDQINAIYQQEELSW